MKKLQLTYLLMFLVLCASAGAEEKPMQLNSDERIETVPFVQNNVVPVYGRAFNTTQITFGKEEQIENIQNGDMSAWTVSVNKDAPYMVFIKPTVNQSNTNMVIVTNKHTYYFQLQVGMQDAGKRPLTYAIHFTYPHQAYITNQQNKLVTSQMRAAQLSAFTTPGNFNWDYSFNGDKRLVPLHVFDDGKFTYLQLQKNQPIPAVFAVDNADGKEALVNYRQQGQYLVIQRIAPQFTLRAGKHQVATLFNNKLIKKMPPRL